MSLWHFPNCHLCSLPRVSCSVRNHCKLFSVLVNCQNESNWIANYFRPYFANSCFQTESCSFASGLFLNVNVLNFLANVSKSTNFNIKPYNQKVHFWSTSLSSICWRCWMPHLNDIAVAQLTSIQISYWWCKCKQNLVPGELRWWLVPVTEFL